MHEPLRLHLLAEALDLTKQGALYYATLHYTVLRCSLELQSSEEPTTFGPSMKEQRQGEVLCLV